MYVGLPSLMKLCFYHILNSKLRNVIKIQIFLENIAQNSIECTYLQNLLHVSYNKKPIQRISHSYIDKYIILLALNNRFNADIIWCVPPYLLDDESICKPIVCAFPNTIIYISRKLRNGYSFCLHILKQRPELYCYISQRLRNNFTLYKLVVKKNPHSLTYASYRIRDDPTLCDLAISLDPLTFKYISYRLKNNYVFCVKYLLWCPYIYQYISHRLKDNYVLCHMVIQNDLRMVHYASARLRTYFYDMVIK